jgi:hypothetical protein
LQASFEVARCGTLQPRLIVFLARRHLATQIFVEFKLLLLLLLLSYGSRAPGRSAAVDAA